VAIIINPHIHEDFKETREKFLERVECVKAIRTNRDSKDEGLTLYIHSLPTFNLYRYIKNAIDKGDFSGLDSYYDRKHFGIEISDKLYSWFKNNELDTIMRQVICWLSALYWLEPNKREIMDRQLYLYIAEEVRKVYSTYFEKEINSSNIKWEKAQEHTKRLYHSVCLDYYGSLPPAITDIYEPFGLQENVKKLWWFHDEFDIRLDRFYFRHDDWERIVIRQENDDLLRVESSKDIWSKWKHQFSTFNENKSNVYSLFSKEVAKGYVYIIKQTEEYLYKIGYTKSSDITKRLSQLQTGNPYHLEIIGSFQCAGQATEKALHSLFSQKRKTGEWYGLNPEDVKNILDQNWRTSENIF
jgi:Meiotically up-regulated gene 113